MKKKELIGCCDTLKKKTEDILMSYDFSNVFFSLKNERFDEIKPYKIELLVNKFKQISERESPDKLETIRKIVILECLISSWDELYSEKYPLSIQQQFMKNAERFLNMSQNANGWGHFNDDVYWKDLAIARQQIFPAGAGIVEVYSGIGLRAGLSLNVLKTFSFLKFLFSSGGDKPYYQIHTHTPLLSDFNEQGWCECYLRIAEMLIKNKNIKGVVRGSWFCDPALESISPWLTYLQKMPVENGASLFFLRKDQTGNAFSKSKKRLKLYNDGKYQPKTYLLTWPRNELIKWARNFGCQ